MIYRVETETEGREVYCIEAADEDEAREKFAKGEAGQPTVAEVTGASVTSVEPCDASDC